MPLVSYHVTLIAFTKLFSDDVSLHESSDNT